MHKTTASPADASRSSLAVKLTTRTGRTRGVSWGRKVTRASPEVYSGRTKAPSLHLVPARFTLLRSPIMPMEPLPLGLGQRPSRG